MKGRIDRGEEKLCGDDERKGNGYVRLKVVDKFRDIIGGGSEIESFPQVGVGKN